MANYSSKRTQRWLFHQVVLWEMFGCLWGKGHKRNASHPMGLQWREKSDMVHSPCLIHREIYSQKNYHFSHFSSHFPSPICLHLRESGSNLLHLWWFSTACLNGFSSFPVWLSWIHYILQYSLHVFGWNRSLISFSKPHNPKVHLLLNW